MAVPSKYALYEKAVQSPKWHADWQQQIYRDLRGGKFARHLREDFCGTFQISCEWVKKNRANTATGLDLDPEPLAYGRRHHLSKLTAAQKQRLKLLKQNVISITDPKVDIVAVGNFSFCIFHTRRELLAYFRAVLRSLRPGGVLTLELAGGPGMIEELRDRKALRERGKTIATYIWDQVSFDPVQRRGKYAIHFHFPGNGRRMRNAFTYDWRLWTIPELRDALADAGFAKTHVYWETEHEGEGTGEYVRSETGDNAYSWVGYVVGEKAAK